MTKETISISDLTEHLLSSEFQYQLGRTFGSIIEPFGVSKLEEVLDVEQLHDKLPSIDDRVAQTIKDNARLFNPRLQSHIKRLTNPNRSVAENYFGVLCGYYGVREGREVLPNIASGQFDNTTYFWTVSPYLASELRSLGMPPSKIMETITMWAKLAKGDVVSLQGIAELSSRFTFGNYEPILSATSTDKSHEFAKGLAHIVCNTVSIFKDAISAINPLQNIDTTLPLLIVD